MVQAGWSASLCMVLSFFFKWSVIKWVNLLLSTPLPSQKNNMEAARVLIIVDNLDCFNKIIAVEIGNYRYHISIQEEFGNPFSFINSGLISEKAASNNSQGSCALSSNADGSYIPRKQLKKIFCILKNLRLCMARI